MNANDSSASAATKEEHDDNMQRAFEEFMLTGGKKAIASAVIVSSSSTPTVTSQLSSVIIAAQQRKNQQLQRQRQQQQRSIYKSHQSALQDFHIVLVRDWLHIDDQLGRVVDSVANLRHRIKITSARLHNKQQQELQSSSLSSSKRTIYSAWKNHGYRRRQQRGGDGDSISMTCQNKPQEQQEQQQQQQKVDDLELTLSHSLLMHEKMMATLRKPLLPLLHEAQETLGRRLQDCMAVVEECCVADIYDDDAHIVDDNDNPENDHDNNLEWRNRLQADLQKCHELYRALAQEVYRKQDLIQLCILDTVQDGLLVVLQNNNSESDDWTTNPPLQASGGGADWCSAQWSRQGKASVLYKFRDYLLDLIQQQQEEEQQDDNEDQKNASAAT